MANSDKNILITPNTGSTTLNPTIRFTGADNTPITLRTLDNGTVSFEGTAGQLFSISDGLTGTIFSVNDISGIPSIEVVDTGEVRIAQYSGNVGIGKTSPTTKLDVNGTVTGVNLNVGYATTATAAGTTTLTVSSPGRQFFTGSTTQTVVLPVATTLTLGHSYIVHNASSGVVTVQSSGANTVATLSAGVTGLFICILVSGTTAASWYYMTASGIQGTTGTQGTTGPQGITGSQGTTGLQGLTGIQGALGNQGTNGTQGATGTQGTIGSQGTTGIQGTEGSAGSQGTTGTQGTSGTNGSQGTTGFQGTTGTQGTTGLQGITGTQGTSGTNGTQGATGTQGTSGTNGSQGTTGSQGATGTQGTTGSQGTTGLQGIQGTVGIQGLTGSQGITGAQGLTGTGTQGTQGIQGLQGTSIQGVQGPSGSGGSGGGFTYSATAPVSPVAGDRWIDSDTGIEYTYINDGNTSQWIEAGPAGYTGPQGLQGLTGTQGTDGIQGLIGLQGFTGLQGLTGLQGTTGLQGLTGIQGTRGVADGTITLIIDGGGSVITTGIKGYLKIPFGCTITEWTILNDVSGSITIDIWKDTYANYPPTIADTITGSAKPLTSSATKGQSATLTGWTTSIANGDILAFNVDSVSSITRATISLSVSKV